MNTLSSEVTQVHLSAYTWLHAVDCSAPAGLILAVTQASGKFQVRTFRPDGGEERTLVEDSERIYSARWSPTGDSIYYLHGKGSTKELSRVSAAREHPAAAVLADGLQTGEFFRLSADGSRLAYTREDRNSNVWRIDLPAAGKKAKPEISRLTSGTSFYGAPSFSPDGRWVAFPLEPNPDETNIFKMEVAGGEPVQVTFFERCYDCQPSLVTGWPAHRFYQRSKRHTESLADQRQWRCCPSAGKHQPFGHQRQPCLVAEPRHCLPTTGTTTFSSDQR